MKREGPPLEALTRHLAETPEDFLAPPRWGDEGTIRVDAVVHDLCARLGIHLPPEAFREYPLAAQGSGKALGRADRKASTNRLQVVLILCWLLDEPWFRTQTLAAGAIGQLLGQEAAALARLTAAPRFVDDPDSREELARLTLARCELRPLGEGEVQARDRLTSISSLERARVLEASRAAEERAREVRAALARKAAQEAADKWTRE